MRGTVISTILAFQRGARRRGVPSTDAGFTLLELLVVLVILGMLVGLVAPQAMQLLGSSKQKVASQSVIRLASILDIYRLDVASYPTSDQGLPALLDPPPVVPGWDRPYVQGDQVPPAPRGHPFQHPGPHRRPRPEFGPV